MREHLLYIDGKWRAGRRGHDPRDQPVLWRDVRPAGRGRSGRRRRGRRGGAAAWPAWAGGLAFDRAAWCEQIVARIGQRRDELARALTQDQGKPLVAEAFDEVDELAEYFTMAGEDAKRLARARCPPPTSADRRVLTTRVPLGVVGVVSPWNWPYTMGAELFAPALAAGNTVVWVPAPTTTACCALLAEVIAEAGLPAGVFNFVPGPGPVVGDALVGHPRVAGVGFVGSVETGASVAARAAGKTQLLELGGNGPMVILDDADLELATDAALEAAYLCAGQSCTAGERFLVRRIAVRAEFAERVVAATQERVRLGDPFDPQTTMGPLNNEATAAKFDRHIADAVAGGARVCSGGRRGTAATGLPDRAVRRADRAGRRAAGDGDRAGGDVRAGRADRRGRARRQRRWS